MANVPALQIPQMQSPLDAYAKVSNLQAMMQQQQLNAEQLRGAQMQNRMQQTQIDEDAAYRKVMADSGNDLNVALPQLMKVAPSKAMQLMEKKRAWDAADVTQKKGMLENEIKRLELLGRYASTVKDEPSKQAAIQQAAQAGVLDTKHATELLQTPFDPATYQGFVAQALDEKDRLTAEHNRLTLEETQRHNKATEGNTALVQAEAARHNRQTEANTVRGQNMTDARSRENNDIQRSNKVEQRKSADMTQLTEFESDMDRLATAAKELLDHPGLGGITGIRGAIPNIPGSQASNAAAKLHNLKTQVAFGTLQKMRNASKTGGALGQVSDNEQKMLMNSVQPLDNSQSNEELKKSLHGIIDYADGAKSRARTAVEQRYAGAPSAPTQTSGFTVTAPDGTPYTFKSQAAAQAFERAIKQGKK